MQPARVIVIEEWSVLRRGIISFVHGPHIVVGEAAACSDLVDDLPTLAPEVLVVGQQTATELAVLDALLAPMRSAPKVIRLVDAPSAPNLREMLRGEVAGVLSRSCSDERLLDAVRSVLADEKVVDPRFLPLLYDGETTTSGAADEHRLLTARELEVLELVATGLPNRKIAEALYVGEATVKTHLSHIYAKLDASDRHHAVGRALELGLLH